VSANLKSAATVSGRGVLRLSLPIILSNLSVPLMGAVDTAVMGHLPDAAYIGGVALGALVFTYVYWGFGFLRMATTGFTAQARGAGDDQELRHVTSRGALMALGLGALIIALQLPLTALAFAVLEGSGRAITCWCASGARRRRSSSMSCSAGSSACSACARCWR
jgi:MATE family multidrug resistance protein